MIKNKSIAPVLFALSAAIFYAINTPFSKLLLSEVPATFMASFLYMGAAKTSAYYAVAPFVGAFLAFVINGEKLTWLYFAALVLMLIGSAFAVYDTIVKSNTETRKER